MAVPVYARAKLFWGAIDVTVNTAGGYTPEETFHLGASAVAATGIGARRASLRITRQPPGVFADDVTVMHFDFVNFTGGAPDDTWTTADYVALEGALVTWWNTTKALVSNTYSLAEIRWYRIGSGITPPNPPQRVTSYSLPGTVSTGSLPPQVACSISLHVAPRRSWGRTYLPGLGTTLVAGTHGVMDSTSVDTLAGATNTMLGQAAAADFVGSVYSAHLGAMLAIESIAVDNVFDVIRSRRWRNPTYRKQLP